MKRITSLNELLLEELADLLDTENQLIDASPKMVQACQLSALKVLLEDHLKVEKNHALRLQDIFSNIGYNPQGSTSKAMTKMLTEFEEVINDTPEGPERDAAIIRVEQRIQQHEIAGYIAAFEHAADLGHTMIVELFNKTLHEERIMNFYLNELAQYMINSQAIEQSPGQETGQQIKPSSKPKTGGFYIQDGKFKRGIVKMKRKRTDVSRFISEGNPNLQNPEEEGDRS